MTSLSYGESPRCSKVFDLHRISDRDFEGEVFRTYVFWHLRFPESGALIRLALKALWMSRPDLRTEFRRSLSENNINTLHSMVNRQFHQSVMTRGDGTHREILGEIPKEAIIADATRSISRLERDLSLDLSAIGFTLGQPSSIARKEHFLKEVGDKIILSLRSAEVSRILKVGITDKSWHSIQRNNLPNRAFETKAIEAKILLGVIQRVEELRINEIDGDTMIEALAR
ncbi:MAG: hypothetical protein HRT44_01225 [Bdellovibrionales bacterium]|nr:hypothetical protein [Bdellovibrionales bacterium]NQZ17870.1 hypothetical protein [Bdellovibrionales bacterium]